MKFLVTASLIVAIAGPSHSVEIDFESQALPMAKVHEAGHLENVEWLGCVVPLQALSSETSIGDNDKEKLQGVVHPMRVLWQSILKRWSICIYNRFSDTVHCSSYIYIDNRLTDRGLAVFQLLPTALEKAIAAGGKGHVTPVSNRNERIFEGYKPFGILHLDADVGLYITAGKDNLRIMVKSEIVRDLITKEHELEKYYREEVTPVLNKLPLGLDGEVIVEKLLPVLKQSPFVVDSLDFSIVDNFN